MNLINAFVNECKGTFIFYKLFKLLFKIIFTYIFLFNFKL